MSLWYLTGTVTLTNGSNEVTGVGTAWVGIAKANDIFYTPSGGMYEVLSVSANNQLRLVTPYVGQNLTNVPYAIVSTQGFNVSLAIAMTALIPELAAIRDAYAAGADPASAAAASASAAQAAAAQAAANAGGASAINDAVAASTSVWSSTKTNTAIAGAVAALINDSVSTSTSKTLSATKINDLIATAKTAIKNELTNGSAAALDTLNELAQALGNDPAFAATIGTALANRVRTDVSNQGLSDTQRGNAIVNLGLASVLARVLPANGLPGQIPVRTTDGYVWVDRQTDVIPIDPTQPDYSSSVAAVNASALNMRTKTAQLAS